jgi:hypothetical protein
MLPVVPESAILNSDTDETIGLVNDAFSVDSLRITVEGLLPLLCSLATSVHMYIYTLFYAIYVAHSVYDQLPRTHYTHLQRTCYCCSANSDRRQHAHLIALSRLAILLRVR